MKCKRGLLIVGLVICVLLGLSTVCASDVNDTMVASDDANQIIEANDGEVVSSADGEVVSSADNELMAFAENEDVLGAAASGTFAELQKKIDAAQEGSTITLDKDYKYNSGFSVNGIDISKDLTINGNGHKLDGLSKSRIFDISGKVTLNNINFVNGNANKNDGGAIFAYDLTINSCKFTNNKANNGGAIYIRNHGELIVKKSTFNKNSAKSAGGAIGTVLDDDPFTVVYGYSYYTVINVVDSTFTGNSASNGGAILANDDLKVTSSKFTSNKASDGGAIWVHSGLQTTSSSFKSNKASCGGAIYVSTGKNVILDSTFTSNSVTNQGGAIYFYYWEKDDGDASFVYNSKFTSNIAKGYKDSTFGGAIYTHNGKNYVTASSCTFYKNKVCFEDTGMKKYNDVYNIKTKSCVFLKDKLTLKKVKVKKSAKKLILKASLKLNNGKAVAGKTITFKFNGKTYKTKTNKKGVAKAIIKKKILKKLKVGKKVKYQVSYDLLKVKKTAKVKK